MHPRQWLTGRQGATYNGLAHHHKVVVRGVTAYRSWNIATRGSLMLLAVLLGACAATAAGDRAAVPVPLGSAQSRIYVQNSGVAPTTVLVDYYDAAGSRITSDKARALPPGFAHLFSQAYSPRLPAGYRGTAVVTAGQPTSELIINTFRDNYSLSMGAQVGQTKAYSHLYIPTLYRHAGRGWRSRFAIVNVGKEPASVTITYFDGDGRLLWAEFGVPIPANGTLTRDQPDMPWLSRSQFGGSAQVLEEKGRESLIGRVEIYAERSFSTYSAPGPEDAATTVLLPLIAKNYGPSRLNSRFIIQNSRASARTSTPARVWITYHGDKLPGGWIKIGPFPIASTQEFRQEGDVVLPDDFLGYAVIEADVPIIAVAHMTQEDNRDYLSSYRGLAPGAFRKIVYLPLVYRDFFAGLWNSEIRIQAAEGGSSLVRVTYYGQGCLQGCSPAEPVVVLGAASLPQKGEAVLPRGFQGTAVLEVVSGKPIAALVTIESPWYQGDLRAMYPGQGR